MACIICRVEFFAALAIVAFGALGLTMHCVVTANRHEMGGDAGGVGRMLRVRGFFNPAAYGDAQARLWMGRARTAAWVAILTFALFYLFAGLVYLGDLCTACPAPGA